jgi:hypothetical protein
LRARTIRTTQEQAVDWGAFPVPPLPTAKEKSNA